MYQHFRGLDKEYVILEPGLISSLYRLSKREGWWAAWVVVGYYRTIEEAKRQIK